MKVAIKVLAAAVAAACMASEASAGDSGRLVRRVDFDIPESWAPPEIMGRNYRPMLAPGMWACPGKYNDERAKRLGQGLLPRPDWLLFRDCALHVHGLNMVTPRILARMTKPETWRIGEADRAHPAGTPFRIREFFTDKLVSQFVDNPKNYVPIFATLANARPAFFLDGKYDMDVEGFGDWKSRNPNFCGFVAQAELESDIHWYLDGLDKCTNAEVRARMLREFPPPTCPRDLAPFVKKTWERTRGFYFGESRIWGLSAGTYSYSHLHAANGAAGLFSECSAAWSLARWQIATAFLRGAARQYGIPFGHYFAHYYSGMDRMTGKFAYGENKWGRYPWSDNVPTRDGTDYAYKGVSRSLTDRANAYSWFSGASFSMPENDAGLYFVLGDDGKYRPSDYARDLDRLYHLTLRVQRGTTYVPVALVVSGTELHGNSFRGVSKEGKYWFDDVFSQQAFFYTLVPVNAENEYARRRRGLEDCLFNSPFGEVYDVLAGDLGQKTDDMVRALSGYKAAFLVGGLRRDDTDCAALERYVREGGTLVVSADRVSEGFVSPELAGVSFDGAVAESGTAFADGEPLEDAYRWRVGRSCGARPFLKDDLGNVAVWAHDVGPGRVVVASSWRMLPAEYEGFRETLTDTSPVNVARYMKKWNKILSGERRFALIRRLLAAAQSETMPLSVAGDIQWGVNKSHEGWVVWLVNNRGVTHFSCEPETFDEAGTAHVTVDLKSIGPAAVRDFRTNERFTAEDRFSVDVPPGGWRIFGLRPVETGKRDKQ